MGEAGAGVGANLRGSATLVSGLEGPPRPRLSPASVSPVRCSEGDGVFVSWISPKRRCARSPALCLSLRARHPAPGAGWGRGDGRGGERARGGPAGPQGRARGERPPSGLVSAYP